MAQAPRKLTPTRSPQDTLGAELRHWRELRGLSQDELGTRVYVSGDTLSKVEGAKRFPPRELMERCDEALSTGGILARLWDLANAHRLDRRTRSARQASHVDTSNLDLQEALTAGTMKLRIDEGGNVWAEVNRRSFLVGSAAALIGQGGASEAAGLPVGSQGFDTANDPFGFARMVTANWPGLRLSRPVPDYGVDWTALMPDGKSMLGSNVPLQLHPARVEGSRAVVSIPDQRRADSFLDRPGRGLLVGAAGDDDSPQFYVLDGRNARSRLNRSGGIQEVTAPLAYELDDLTFGILWAVSNYDDALQADDQALAETRTDLERYDRLSSSAVSREAAPGLNAVAHMWLGSDFCARHILKALPDLPELPAFWTREQRGEEASAWLIFDHKYPYLQATTRALGGPSTRAFCVPEGVVRTSPRHERILLFLAVALMESLGIHAQFTSDASYEAVEGFVVSPSKEAIIANWVRGDGMWHVDVTGRSSIVREFTNAAGDVGAESIIKAPTAAGRLRALANYLDLPWGWLIRRCAQLGKYGTSGLIQSRSRLVSAAGLDAACAYVGTLPADG
ncbi:helix-turn-helix domain-containing protein [Streptomyces sp. NPDC059991]|uniref:helix-turn-helix domain-containing protein n=1 Tax=Streptomyces sp. NPDC059991 TaxID=3347028 RepID=UPI0036B2BA17